ncbi:hypothetical protein A5867_000876, partial [Enterococcus sp. 6D12_DIV0197]
MTAMIKSLLISNFSGQKQLISVLT